MKSNCEELNLPIPECFCQWINLRVSSSSTVLSTRTPSETLSECATLQRRSSSLVTDIGNEVSSRKHCYCTVKHSYWLAAVALTKCYTAVICEHYVRQTTATTDTDTTTVAATATGAIDNTAHRLVMSSTSRENRKGN
jgi:hypothetical protein